MNKEEIQLKAQQLKDAGAKQEDIENYVRTAISEMQSGDTKKQNIPSTSESQTGGIFKQDVSTSTGATPSVSSSLDTIGMIGATPRFAKGMLTEVFPAVMHPLDYFFDVEKKYASLLGANIGNFINKRTLEKKLADPNISDEEKNRLVAEAEAELKYIKDLQETDIKYKGSTSPLGIASDVAKTAGNIATMHIGGPGWSGALKQGLTFGGTTLASEELKKAAGESDKSQLQIVGQSAIDTVLGTTFSKFFDAKQGKGLLAESLVGKNKVIPYLEKKAANMVDDIKEMLPTFTEKAGTSIDDAQKFLSNKYNTFVYDTAEKQYLKSKDSLINTITEAVVPDVDKKKLFETGYKAITDTNKKVWDTKNANFAEIFNQPIPVTPTNTLREIQAVKAALGKSPELSDDAFKTLQQLETLEARLTSASQFGTAKIKGEVQSPGYTIKDFDAAMGTLWKDGSSLENKYLTQVLNGMKQDINGAIKGSGLEPKLNEAFNYLNTEVAERSKDYIKIWENVSGKDRFDEVLSVMTKDKITAPQIQRMYAEMGDDAANQFREAMMEKIVTSSTVGGSLNGKLLKDNIDLAIDKGLLNSEQAAKLSSLANLADDTFENFLNRNDKSDWAKFGEDIKGVGEQKKQLDLLKGEGKGRIQINTQDPSLFADSIAQIKSKEQAKTALSVFTPDEKDAISKLVLDDFYKSGVKITEDGTADLSVLMKKLNNMSLNLSEELFTKDQIKIINVLQKQLQNIKNIEEVPANKIQGVLSLFMGTMQAGRGYPGAIFSFENGVKALLGSSAEIKAAKSELLSSGMAFNDQKWKNYIVGIRDFLRNTENKKAVPFLGEITGAKFRGEQISEPGTNNAPTFSIEEVTAMGLPESLVGYNENKFAVEKLIDTPPQWFIEYANQNGVEQKSEIKKYWDNFRK